MKQRISVLALVCAASVVGCESGRTPGGDNVERSAAAATAPKPAAAAPAPIQSVAAPSAPAPANVVHWHGDIEWHTWSDALPLARKEGKPIMVVVYADWCPHCRALGPVFADPDIESMAKHLVMVRQDNEENPAWLQPYNEKYGSYVPRIFFFDSSGKMREDLTSGHPQYPYFYAAEQPAFLKRTMQRAIGT